MLTHVNWSNTLLSNFRAPCNLKTVAMAYFAPRFTVSKDPSLADEPIHLVISDLNCNRKYTLHASVCLPNSLIFESFSHYVADGQGSIDVNQHRSLGGDYTGIEPMGPLSFMKPSVLNKRKHGRFMIKKPSKPYNVDFRLFKNFIMSSDESAKDRFQIRPCCTITRTYMAPGVKEIPVWHGNVRATLYLPSGKGPFPGVISMSGGGYPGAMKYKAALLASHGFAALALKYFGEDDLPENFFYVEMEYIEEAARFLADHPSVSGERGVGIIGNCYGGNVALASASVLPKGLIRCVVSINGWYFPYGMMSYQGKQIVSGPTPKFDTWLDENGIEVWKMKFPPELVTMDCVKSCSFPCFERSDVSYLFVVGDNDGYVASEQLSALTRQFFLDATHPDFKILYYKGAGHLIEHSFYPLASIAFTFREPHFNGGRQPWHSMAQNDSWPKILEFVQNRLYPSLSKL